MYSKVAIFTMPVLRSQRLVVPKLPMTSRNHCRRQVPAGLSPAAKSIGKAKKRVAAKYARLRQNVEREVEAVRIGAAEIPGPSAPQHPLDSVEGITFFADEHCGVLAKWTGSARYSALFRILLVLYGSFCSSSLTCEDGSVFAEDAATAMRKFLMKIPEKLAKTGLAPVLYPGEPLDDMGAPVSLSAVIKSISQPRPVSIAIHPAGSRPIAIVRPWCMTVGADGSGPTSSGAGLAVGAVVSEPPASVSGSIDDAGPAASGVGPVSIQGPSVFGLTTGSSTLNVGLLFSSAEPTASGDGIPNGVGPLAPTVDFPAPDDGPLPGEYLPIIRSEADAAFYSETNNAVNLSSDEASVPDGGCDMAAENTDVPDGGCDMAAEDIDVPDGDCDMTAEDSDVLDWEDFKKPADNAAASSSAVLVPVSDGPSVFVISDDEDEDFQIAGR